MHRSLSHATSFTLLRAATIKKTPEQESQKQIASMPLKPQPTRSQATLVGSFQRQDVVRPAQSLGPTRQDSRRHLAAISLYNATQFDVWLLGITIVIGGQYVGWNVGMNQGLYTNLLCFGLTSVAYILLCCCTAEIGGALPFAGGAYGLARCTLGFFPGFLIGCCEALEYIAYVAASVVLLSDLIIEAVPSLEHYDPLIWAIFYVTALFFHIRGGRVFWYFNALLGIVSMGILLVYCLGSLAFVSFDQNAHQQNPNDFEDGFNGFMHVFPISVWFFVGVEALNLANDQVQEPRQVIPRAQIICVLTLFVTGLMVFFVTVSLPPGLSTLASVLAPFERGFVPMTHLSKQSAIMLSLPATYATSFGFMWCYGKLIASMATSKLLPRRLGAYSESWGTCYVAVFCGSILSYGLCLLSLFFDGVVDRLFTLCVLSAFMSYTGQCIGYISLRTKYKSIKSSSFRNPFGVYGAFVAMLIWCLHFVAAGFFQGTWSDLITFMGVVLLLTCYYFLYARHHQIFSSEENRILLVAHILKFNTNKRNSNTRKIQQRSSQLSVNHSGTSHQSAHSSHAIDKQHQPQQPSSSRRASQNRVGSNVITVTTTCDSKYKSRRPQCTSVQPSEW